MRRAALLFHVLLAVVLFFLLAVYWGLLLMYGRGGWLRLGPIAYGEEILICASILFAPACFFSSCRVLQILGLEHGLFLRWKSLRGISNVFAFLTGALLSFVLVLDTPWKSIRQTDWNAAIQEMRNPQAGFTVNDEEIAYPALPLQPPDPYVWSLYDMDGKEIPMAKFKGKPLFLNEWATWCPPCRAEMPSLQRLYEAMKDSGVAFVFVSKETPEVVKEFAQKNSYSFPVYCAKDPMPDSFERGGIPSTFIVGADGQVVFSHVGAAAWDTQKTTDFLKKLLSSVANSPEPTSVTPVGGSQP